MKTYSSKLWMKSSPHGLETKNKNKNKNVGRFS
jgi:hypothetical protein